jgi:hypothetical protein
MLSFVEIECVNVIESIKIHENLKETMNTKHRASTSVSDALHSLSLVASSEDQKELLKSLSESFTKTNIHADECVMHCKLSEQKLVEKRRELNQSILKLFRVYEMLTVVLEKPKDVEVAKKVSSLQPPVYEMQVDELAPSGFENEKSNVICSDF